MYHVVAYNVANLAKSIESANFLSFLNKFEIFFLYETHVIEEKQSLFEVYFKNYTIHWIPTSLEEQVEFVSTVSKKMFRNILCLNLKIFLTTLCSWQNLMKSGFILLLIT